MANTHETFIRAVADLAAAKLTTAERDTLSGIKLVYGSGPSGTRGVTYYGKWKSGRDGEARPFVEVSAFGQESWVQVAGTTLHELGHVLAGWGAGHGKLWHEACAKLGLRKIRAAGTRYCLANFDPELRCQIAALPRPDEGEPVVNLTAGGMFPYSALKPCAAGVGTRGGKSRGKGSGSRLRKWVCGCGQIVRASTDELQATHDPCGTPFKCE